MRNYKKRTVLMTTDEKRVKCRFRLVVELITNK